MFAAERAAIGNDAELKSCIFVRAMADLRRLSKLGSGCEEGAPISQAELHHDANVAFSLLHKDALASRVNLAAHDDPDLLDDIIAATELLRLDPPIALGPERHRNQCAALANAILLMYRISLPSAHTSPRVLAFKDTLRCLGVAAAAGIHILRAGGGTATSVSLDLGSKGLMLVLDSVIKHSLLPDGSVPPGTEAVSWAAHYRALEGMVRLAALAPTSLPVGSGVSNISGTQLADTILEELWIMFPAVFRHEPTAVPDEDEVWTSLASLVGSAVKLALRAAGPGAETPSEAKLECVYTMVAGCCARNLVGKENEEGFPLRRVCSWPAVLVK